jgi:hypothetical protein
LNALGTPDQPAFDFLTLGKGYDRLFRFHDTTLPANPTLFTIGNMGDTPAMAGNFA